MSNPSTGSTTQARIVSDLLGQGRVMHLLSGICSGIACFGLVVGVMLTMPASLMIGLTLSLLAGLAELVLAMRTGFDARLFRRLGEGEIDLAAFDMAMLATGLMPPSKAGRPLEQRSAGARSLLRWQAIAVTAQVLIIIVTVWLTKVTG